MTLENSKVECPQCKRKVKPQEITEFMGKLRCSQLCAGSPESLQNQRELLFLTISSALSEHLHMTGEGVEDCDAIANLMLGKFTSAGQIDSGKALYKKWTKYVGHGWDLTDMGLL